VPQSHASRLRPPPRPAPPGGLGLASDSARLRMVEALAAGGVRDADVLAAMRAVPRHVFVEPALASRAYEDVALPIGHGQTISRPSTVARMLETVLADMPAARRAEARVLEIGTGCGYQAALMAALFGEVLSIERVRGLHDAARQNLRALRLANLRLAFGDGRLGMPSSAPFDAIVLAAAGDRIPDALLEQLGIGARLIGPVGDGQRQALHLVERTGPDSWELTVLDAARFVPLREGTS
jgi:protein-L-isoaspartate(D-aspartate) O-methyltransferase